MSGPIPLMFAGLVGALVALFSPLIAAWIGIALWGGASLQRIGILVLAMGFTSGALSGSAIRLGFMLLIGPRP